MSIVKLKFPCGASPRFWVMASHYVASRSHSMDTSYSVEILRTSDQPNAERSHHHP